MIDEDNRYSKLVLILSNNMCKHTIPGEFVRPWKKKNKDDLRILSY